MKTCTSCRSQLPDTYTACPNCGSTNLVFDQSSMYQGQPVMPGQPMGNMQQPMPGPYAQSVDDKGSIGWGILGFFIPLVGFILWLCWKNTKPKTAKVAGLGGLIGFALNFIIIMSKG